jgi:ATP-dependent DNA ligase
MGLEGIVSKRKDSRYSSGRSLHWIKCKNPDVPAVKREAEKDWGEMAEEGQALESVTLGHIRSHGCRAPADLLRGHWLPSPQHHQRGSLA